MLAQAPCRPTIAVSDIVRAKAFYADTLGLSLKEEAEDGVTFSCGDGTHLEIYPSQYAGTAKSTLAGFEVPDIEATMKGLREKGVVFEDYDFPGLKTENGIATLGPNRAAWFKDPDGNILAVVSRS